MIKPTLVTRHEAAKILGVPISTVSHWTVDRRVSSHGKRQNAGVGRRCKLFDLDELRSIQRSITNSRLLTMPPGYIRPLDAGAKLGLTTVTINLMISDGRLRGIKMSGGRKKFYYMVEAAHVAEIVAQSEAEAASPAPGELVEKPLTSANHLACLQARRELFAAKGTRINLRKVLERSRRVV